jgi:hypothetical protein
MGESESQKRRQDFLDTQQEKESLEKEAAKRNRRIVTLESFAKTAIEKNGTLLDIKKRLEGMIAQHQGLHNQKEKELNAIRTQLDGVCDDLKTLRRRTEKALQKDGRTWSEKVLANAPEFIPLEPGSRLRRRMRRNSVKRLFASTSKPRIQPSQKSTLTCSWAASAN